MNRQKLSTVAVSLWSRDQGEPGREGAAASGHDPPAVRSAGPAPDCALGAEEHGRDAPGKAAAADGAGPAAAGAGGPCSLGWAPSGTAGSMVGPAPWGGHLQAPWGVWGALLSRAGTVGSVGQAWLAQAEATGGWGGGHRKGLSFPPLGVHQSLQEDQGGGCWGALSESSQLLPGLSEKGELSAKGE